MLKKLSLAALIAMGSMSVGSATPLTEAIKGVNLSGMLRIRFYNDDPEDGLKTDRWRTNGIFVFKVPVDEHIKFVYRASVQTDATGLRDNGDNTKTGALSLNNVDTGTMNNLLFMSYTNGPLNAIIGKIPVKTPITSADPVTPGHGAGIIATYNVGSGLTLAGGYIDALKHANPADYENYAGWLLSTSIYTAAAIYKSDVVDGQLWFFRLPNVVDGEYVLSANVKALKDMGLTFEANYAKSNMAEETGLDDKTYYDITAKYNNAGIHALLGYANASDDNGFVTTACDSPLGTVLPTQQRINIANDIDTDSWYAMLGYDVNSALNVSLRYASFNDKSDADNDADEWVVQGDYKYNKKLSFRAYYSVYNEDADGADNNEFQFQALYKF
jgi:hypothetical protein